MSSLLELQEKQVILNSQFQENQGLIERLQDTLIQDLTNLNLDQKDLILTKQFISDKASVFRSLKEFDFNFDNAHSNLLTTIQWRLDNNIDQLNMSDCLDFAENGFAFFHGTDNAGDHPLIFVRLRCFPKQFRTQKPLTEQIRLYASFIMEIARKLTWDMTLKRMKQGHEFPLVSRMTVLVNVTKSPMLPVEPELIKIMGFILNERYPNLIQSINVLNFGWMYQGIWSVLKYLLSEEAKSFIRFTTIQELSSTISKDRIIEELGGSSDFKWTIENDEILQQYGKGYVEQIEEIPPSPSSQSPLDRNDSISNTSDSSDEFFDAQDTLPPLIQQPLISPPTIALVAPQSITEPPLLTTTRPLYGNLSSWAGLRMGVDFLTSFIDTKPPTSDPPDNIIIVEPVTTTSSKVITKDHHFLQDIETFSKNLIHQLVHISFGPHQGLAYWVLIYLFLRGPVESVVKKSLVHTSLVESKRVAATAVGVTAAVAAVVGSGVTSTLERFRRL